MSLASTTPGSRERRSSPRRGAEGNTLAQVLRLAALVILAVLWIGVAAMQKHRRDLAPDAAATLHSAAMR
jgi:hypothetical protein